MHIHRALTFSEASFVAPASRETIGASVELRGGMDTAALQAAFSALLVEYPVLAARVVDIAGRPHFVAGDPSVAGSAGFMHRTEPWAGYAQVPPPFVGSAQLAALALTSDGTRHRCTLWASHSATDGSGLMAITVRLFEFFTVLATGRDPEVAVATDFPVAPDQLMAERGYLPAAVGYDERLGETSWSGAVASAPGDPTAPDADDVLRIRLGEATTRAVGDRAHALGVSVNSLVSGMIAEAELAESGGGALALLTPVDFRGRLDPPIPLRSVTALVGFSFVSTAEAGPAPTAAEIARVVGDRIRADMRDGTILRAAVSPMPDPATRRFGPPVLISNVGEFPLLATPPGLEMHDFQSQIVRSAEGMRRYAAGWHGVGAAPVPLGSSYLLSTFDGRLSIEMRVLPETLDAATRARILRRIESAATELCTELTTTGVAGGSRGAA
ncbi:phthiocerol/phthiodiolone dimycocerosyl transferase family protein [Tsukamurella soli]|uniref:Phthiocerol/phthiodiolone dimycocerosyl transferase n=1 Tax=Tsukamurella soli TaxID=644556 RepID=A0ABP8JZV2_9ACTN